MECDRCDLRHTATAPVWGEGPEDAHIMLIGEAPGVSEDKAGRPFVGRTGSELTYVYLKRAAKIDRSRCYITNAVKCRPPKDKTPTVKQIEACKPFVLEEIRRVSPSVVGLLGAVAVRAVLGGGDISTIHGIPIQRDGVCYLPMYHPAAGLHEESFMISIWSDFGNLGKVVRGQLKPPADAFPRPNYYRVQTKSQLRDLLLSDPVALDTEVCDGQVWCLSLCSKAGEAGVVLVEDRELVDDLRRALQDSHVTLLMHNALFDLPQLHKLGIEPAGTIIDTMVMAYLLQDLPLGLKPLAYRLAGMWMRDYSDVVRPRGVEMARAYLTQIAECEWPKVGRKHSLDRRAKTILADLEAGKEISVRERWEAIDASLREPAEILFGPLPEATLRDIPLEEAVEYSARDADATLRIWPSLRRRIEEEALEEVQVIDQDVIEMVAAMREGGLSLDVERVEELEAFYTKQLDLLGKRINRVARKPVNPASPKQVSQLLYEDLKIHRRGKNSTEAKVLETLKSQHPVVDAIIRWRKYNKAIGTFCQMLKEERGPDGRIRPDFSITRTVTGRLACKKPNLMAFPIRDEESRRLRDCFTANDGCLIVSGDYSQIEMRIAAYESQDEKLCKVFKEGADIHAFTASQIFGIPIDRLDNLQHRYPAKRINFGVLYSLSPPGLAEQLAAMGCEGWTIEKCRDFIQEWFRLYSGVRRRMDEKRQEVVRTGSVRDFCGRLRRLPQVFSTDERIRARGLREACSSYIQSGAQEVIKLTMAEMTPVYKQFQAEGHVCRPLLQIHDDLVWEVGAEIVEDFCATFRLVAENVVDLGIPILLDIKMGLSWGQLVEIEREEATSDA